MKVKTFAGNPFEIGRMQGEIYRRNGLDFKNLNIDNELFDGQRYIYNKYYPEFLERLRGVAEGGKFEEDKLIYSFITGELRFFRKVFSPKQQCTIFGVKNDNGAFVGRNYDWYPVAEKFFEVYRLRDPEKNAFIGITDMLVASSRDTKPFAYAPEDTLNDKGLYIGLTFAHRNAHGFGLSNLHILELIAQNCDTVEEALRIFEEMPVCTPKNFFIADKTGDMAVVEHAFDKFRILRPENGVLIQTNHYTDPELKRYDEVFLRYPKHNTLLRYDEVKNKIMANKEKLDRADIIKILGKVGSCVCQNNKYTRTIWSISIDTKRQDYTLYWDLLGKRKKLQLEV